MQLVERDIRELARKFLAFVHCVTRQPGIVCDEDGTIVEAIDRSRIGSVHVAARRVISVEADEAFVTPQEAARDPRMRPGVIVPAADAVAENAPERIAAISVSSTARDGGIEIAVEENGPGLSLEAQAHLFEPFFTTNGPSHRTAVGLAAAREHVDRHGGRIEGHNRPGAGARFALWLPARPA